jgi:enamine deaminase RidA (YjgF/YER057c/UK114 family)
VVRAAGGDPQSVVRLTIYVTDRSEYVRNSKAVGDAYRAEMGKHYPAMTLVEVKGLLEEGAKLELEATAMI